MPTVRQPACDAWLGARLVMRYSRVALYDAPYDSRRIGGDVSTLRWQSGVSVCGGL
jgi:hypothetical protein